MTAAALYVIHAQKSIPAQTHVVVEKRLEGLRARAGMTKASRPREGFTLR